MDAPALDDALVGRLAERDRSAVLAAYAALADPLFRYLRARSGDPELAADVVGTTFIELVEQAPCLEGGVAGLRRWLFTAARHNLVDEQRKRGRRREVLAGDRPGESEPARDAADVRLSATAEPAPAEGAASPPTPEEQVVDAERDAEVRRALATLPDDQREVLELRFAGALTAAEAGAVMDRSPGAVRVLQHRALGALRQALDGSAPETLGHQTSEDASAAAERVASAPARGPPHT